MVKSRGRPVGSTIRQNIIEILSHAKKGYGYQIFKWHKAIFPDKKLSMRTIYYNLHKGTETGEFKLEKTEKKTGNFSWGSEVNTVMFSLGAKAEPRNDKKVEEYFKKNNS